MSSNESAAYKIMTELNVDYVLVMPLTYSRNWFFYTQLTKEKVLSFLEP